MTCPRPIERAARWAAPLLAAALLAGCSGGTTSTTAATSVSTTATTAPTATTTAAGPAGTTGTAAPPATTAGTTPFAGYTSALYADPANWLCRPGIPTDHCTTDPLDATVIRADGTTEMVPRRVATAPEADCFYVYPTVNYKPGGGNDEDMKDLGLELVVIQQQVARLADVCTVYAPIYRQMNLSAYSSPAAEREKADALAYGDVLDAFKYYLSTLNKGRPIVLVGHSQGSGHLAHLMTDLFDDDEAMRSRLVSALLIGGFVQVPVGKDVGGTFKHLPLCRSTTQTGCVVAYNSFGATPPPDGSAMFGRTTPDGLTGGCVNPANPAGGSGVLQPYIGPSPETNAVATVTTPFVNLPDAISAECVTDDQRTYLAIAAATKPGDKRDVTKVVASAPGWGLHLTEFNLTIGNLLDLVRAEVAAFG